MFKKTYKITALVLISYAFLGFIVLPLVVKSQIIAQVAQVSDAKISIESIYFNPFSFFVEVSGVELTSAEEKKLLSLKSLAMNLQVSSLFVNALHVKEFTLEKPQVSLTYNQDKTLNFGVLFKNKEPKKEDENTSFHMPRVILETVTIVDGRVNYEDFTTKHPFDFAFENIGFELKNIDTKDFNTSNGVFRFYSHLSDGGFVDLRSEVLGLQPLKLKGTLNIDSMQLYSSYRYIQDALNIEVADGKASLGAHYDFNMQDINATTLTQVNLSLEKLRIKSKKTHKDLVTLESFSLKNATLKPMLQDVHVPNIELQSLYARVQRDKNEQIDWLEYFKTQNTNAAEPQKEENVSAPWHVAVENISLEKMRLDFNDKAVSPSVQTQLKEVNLYAQNLTLDGTEPLLYQLNLQLGKEGNCKAEGSVKHKVSELTSSAECKGLDVVQYAPYLDAYAKKELKVYDLSLESLVAGFDANVALRNTNSAMFLSLENANLTLNNFALNKKSTKESLAKFSTLKLGEVKVNTDSRHVEVAKVSLESLDVSAQRYKNKRFNFEDLLLFHEKKEEPKQKPQASQAYSYLVGHVEVRDSKVTFSDKTLSPNAQNRVDKITLNAYELNSNKDKWLRYNLSLALNKGGLLTSKGELKLSPLRQKGTFELQKISLKEFAPYVLESAFVRIDDGYLSLKTKTSYAKSRRNADLKVLGSLKLEELFVSDSRDKTPILSLNEAKLNSLTFELSPNRLFVEEADVNSFYVNALIDEKKQINLSSLMKPTKATEKTEQTESKSEPFALKVMKTNVTLGSANFSDLSLPIKFQTNIHDLNGVIYAISNAPDETSYIDISGEVDRYGSTKLKGSVNTGNPKAFTDLDFNFRNLDLEAMSGYSASFAGHKIEKGKLFLNLEYEIMNSELLGENNIVIKNIKLGDVFKDTNTSLPLGFVISLLEDRDGVIDINMPVKGNVDAPDFKYGALVWKTFAGMILKAVASPFSILGAMIGVEGEKLEYAAFEAGSVKILPPEQEKLDNIAKLLMDKPKISLAVGGRYDNKLDRRVLQKAKLSGMFMQKSEQSNEENQVNATDLDMLEDIYIEKQSRKKLRAMKEELRSKFKAMELQRAYFNTLFEACVEFQTLQEKELHLLAQQREEAIKSYLIEKRGVDVTKITSLGIGEVQSEADKLVRNKLQVLVK